MKNIQLTNLTVEEINQILRALSQQPYIHVYELIHKIRAEATQQLNGQGEKADELEKEPAIIADNVN